jgi:hypothetical protein
MARRTIVLDVNVLARQELQRLPLSVKTQSARRLSTAEQAFAEIDHDGG